MGASVASVASVCEVDSSTAVCIAGEVETDSKLVAEKRSPWQVETWAFEAKDRPCSKSLQQEFGLTSQPGEGGFSKRGSNAGYGEPTLNDLELSIEEIAQLNLPTQGVRPRDVRVRGPFLEVDDHIAHHFVSPRPGLVVNAPGQRVCAREELDHGRGTLSRTRQVPQPRSPELIEAADHFEPRVAAAAFFMQPLLFEIVSFVSSARNLLAIELVSRAVHLELAPAWPLLWEEVYARKWPALHASITCRNAACVRTLRSDLRHRCWRTWYRNTILGSLECTLEVLREERCGFSKTAMCARVSFDVRQQSYIARYSHAEQATEVIPITEEKRLRFCPRSVCDQLRPQEDRCSLCSDSLHGREADGCLHYPYKVLRGWDQLTVGSPVELQWRSSPLSPFSWWYGHLESLTIPTDDESEVHSCPAASTKAQATVVFSHFPAESRWHRLQVVFGDGQPRVCAFGGFTGGLRLVEEDEDQWWCHFLPTMCPLAEAAGVSFYPRVIEHVVGIASV